MMKIQCQVLDICKKCDCIPDWVGLMRLEASNIKVFFRVRSLPSTGTFQKQGWAWSTARSAQLS